MSFKTTKLVNLPTLSFKEVKLGEFVIVKIVGKIYLGKQLKSEGKQQEKPADLCEVLNLMMDPPKPYTLVVPAVVKSSLEETYPGTLYVGKVFKITFMGKAEGKRYKQFQVEEGEYTPDAAPAPAKTGTR
jgi:hypothetical protein